MANLPSLSAGILSADELKTYGIKVTTGLTAQAEEIFHNLDRQGKFTSDKVSTYIPTDLLIGRSEYDGIPEEKLQRSELKQNSLLAHCGGLSVNKWVQSNSAQRLIGGDRSHSLTTLRRTTNGQGVLSFDGTEASMARTTFGPIRAFRLRHANKGPKSIVMFVGAGPTVEWDIKMYLKLFSNDIDRIIICSPPRTDGSTTSAEVLAAKFKDQPVKIEAVSDHNRMLAADIVITATDAYENIIDDVENLRANVTTVATSAYEFRVDYIAKLVAEGAYLSFENIRKCMKRDAQALSLYFIRQAPTLDEQVALAEKTGVTNLSEVDPSTLDPNRAMHISVVGDGSQDLVMAALIALQYARKIGSEATAKFITDALGLEADFELDLED